MGIRVLQVNMRRPRTKPSAKRQTAALIAAAVLLGGEAHAQSGGGPFSLFDSIFTGSVSRAGSTAPSAPRAGTSAQAQGAPTAGSGPLPWSGEDGASGHPLMA